jgi:predicted glycosyltransferase
LDDENYRKEYSDKSKELAGKNTWEEIVKQYNEHFVLAEKELNEIKQETDSYKKIVKYISDKGYVSKRELKAHLNWGIRIPFDAYRNKLRNETKIKFTKYGYGVK